MRSRHVVTVARLVLPEFRSGCLSWNIKEEEENEEYSFDRSACLTCWELPSPWARNHVGKAKRASARLYPCSSSLGRQSYP